MRRVELLDEAQPWERARREGWEGVIAKRRGSPYEHRRSKHWLKMKCEASQELVVGGFTDPQGARVGLGALLVGYYDACTASGRQGLRVRAARSAPGSTRSCCSICAGVSMRSRFRRLPSRKRRAAAPARTLGASGNRRAGRVPRVDRARQAAPSAAARRTGRQSGLDRYAGKSPRARRDWRDPVLPFSVSSRQPQQVQS